MADGLCEALEALAKQVRGREDSDETGTLAVCEGCVKLCPQIVAHEKNPIVVNEFLDTLKAIPSAQRFPVAIGVCLESIMRAQGKNEQIFSTCWSEASRCANVGPIFLPLAREHLARSMSRGVIAHALLTILRSSYEHENGKEPALDPFIVAPGLYGTLLAVFEDTSASARTPLFEIIMRQFEAFPERIGEHGPALARCMLLHLDDYSFCARGTTAGTGPKEDSITRTITLPIITTPRHAQILFGHIFAVESEEHTTMTRVYAYLQALTSMTNREEVLCATGIILDAARYMTQCTARLVARGIREPASIEQQKNPTRVAANYLRRLCKAHGSYLQSLSEIDRLVWYESLAALTNFSAWALHFEHMHDNFIYRDLWKVLDFAFDDNSGSE